MENNAEQPAYPCNYVVSPNGNIFNSNDDKMGGLTKRELLSAMMAQGMLSAGTAVDTLNIKNELIRISTNAIILADSLLSQLQSKP